VRERDERWRRWLAMGLIVLGVLNAIVLGTFTAPRRLARRGLEERRAAVAAELEQEKARLEGRRTEAAVLKGNAADVTRLEREVLGSVDLDLVSTLADVNAMAREGGLHPKGQSYSPSEEKDLNLQKVQISMPLDGSYKALVDFLGRIEDSKRFITIDSVALRAGEKGSGGGLTVSFSAFFRHGGRR
jgi:Tfp pilus assembly protein PilO